MVATRRLIRLRSACLGLATTAVALGVAVVALPATLAPADGGFVGLLVRSCSAAALAAATWLWVLTTEVVAKVLVAGGGGSVVVRRADGVRLLLLATCGVVALAGPASATGPGHHDDRPAIGAPALAGLPLPDRATSEVSRAPAPSSRSHRVRPGDSLWAIAEQRLGPTADTGDVVAYWHRIYSRNAAVIGPDPDLILPGQLLELPPLR